ncbi:MAG: dethiobiotin synthase [Deltaproteobacteria bacterium]|nr:dethiobiotin synthase [Deltaproteobacteria bacterium]
MIGAFITGTDTDVGKTHITCALAAELAREKRVAAVKPVESGCTEGPGGLVASDAEKIAAAAGGWQSADGRCLYRFAAPLAPAVAARLVRRSVDIAECVGFVKAVAAEADLVLVEGAGGWRVPLTDEETIADLARRLGLPVLIVGRAGLGTINHTVLTAEAVARDGCELLGVVLSVRPGDSLSAAMSNADEIARQIRPSIVSLVRDQGDVAAVARRLLDHF